MKNILIYISPTDSFDKSYSAFCVKMNIENSLSLGWKLEDILLITNFDFQYGPVKATVFPDIQYFKAHPQSSKINAIVKMFEKNLIKDNELYWFHDLDAFQLIPIMVSELELKVSDLGITTYEVYESSSSYIKIKKWSTGSFFFRRSAKDIFYKIKAILYDHQINEEKALTELTSKYPHIRQRVKKLNHTYNFVVWLASNYNLVDKPIRVAHFHPGDTPRYEDKIPLIPERLTRIYNYHKKYPEKGFTLDHTESA